MTRPDLIEMLIGLLRGPKGKATADELGLDSSEVSRFIAGQRGLNREQIATAIRLTDSVIVTRQYLDAVCVVGLVGMNCECARMGHGECGKRG